MTQEYVDSDLSACSIVPARQNGRVTSDPVRIVETGYDAMAPEYLSYIAGTDGDPRLRFLHELELRLRDGSTVLDLGCGAGVPCTRLLAQRHTVLGVDISAAQIQLAEELVPEARFLRADFAGMTQPEASFDAVTAFYSLAHVPRELHAGLLQRIASWLRPGGFLLATMSARGDTNGVQDNFIGVPMFFSGYGPDINRTMLVKAGYAAVIDEIVDMQEPDGAASFQWLLAQRL